MKPVFSTRKQGPLEDLLLVTDINLLYSEGQHCAQHVMAILTEIINLFMIFPPQYDIL